MSITQHKQKLTSDKDAERLKALIAVAKERGLELPPDILSKAPMYWAKSEDGYYYRRDGTAYTPNLKQSEFVSSDARFVAFISGRGGGKTAAGSQKAIKKIEQGESGEVLNPDFENLKISTWPEFRDWIPWEQVVARHKYMGEEAWQPSQPFSLHFRNGAKVIIKGLRDPDSARGPNMNWLWYDEAGRDTDGLAWKIANASIRVGDDPQAWLTTTPKGKLHWIYDFFIEQNIDAKAIELFKQESPHRELTHVVFTTIEENKDNLDPAFYASMLTLYPAGWLRRQELGGEFVDQGGVLGDLSWFNGKFLDSPPEIFYQKVRYWDLAASEKKISGRRKDDPDETVGTKVSWEKINSEFYLEDQVGGYWEWKDIKEQILSTAERDGPYVKIWVEQEPGAGGKNQVAELKDFITSRLPGWTLEGHRPEGDKIVRANYWFAKAKLGKIFIVRGNWNEKFLDQFGSFPEVAHDDRVDSVSGAIACLAPIRGWTKMDFITVNYAPNQDNPSS